MSKKQIRTVLNAVAVAMGVAVVVLNIVNPLSLTGTTSLLGVGLAALAIANLQGD
jgi:hypothetical protein